MGLTLIFASWTLTRIYQRRTLKYYRLAVAARLAARPGSGAVPVWVSLCNVFGWAISLVAGIWTTLHFFD